MIPTLLLACAARAPITAPTPLPQANAPACPVRESSPPACTDLDLGRSPERPFEWGLMASGNALWQDSLACADGSRAYVQRTGNIGQAPVVSSSPYARGEPFGGKDILDAWRVVCYGSAVTIFTNLYRCGEVCLPLGWTVLPVEVDTRTEEAYGLLNEGDLEGAVRVARQISAAAPSYEEAWLRHASLAVEAADFPEAVAAFDELLARWQTVAGLSLRWQYAHQAGDPQALPELEALLQRTIGSPGEAGVRCALSKSLEPGPRATELASQACEGGIRSCCP